MAVGSLQGGEVISVCRRHNDKTSFVRLTGFVDGFRIDTIEVYPGDHINWFTSDPRELFLTPFNIDMTVGVSRVE